MLMELLPFCGEGQLHLLNTQIQLTIEMAIVQFSDEHQSIYIYTNIFIPPNNNRFPENLKNYISHNTRFMWYVRPANTQTTLRRCAV